MLLVSIVFLGLTQFVANEACHVRLRKYKCSAENQTLFVGVRLLPVDFKGVVKSWVQVCQGLPKYQIS